MEFTILATFRSRAVQIAHNLRRQRRIRRRNLSVSRTDSSIIALNSAPTGTDFTGGGLQSLGYNIIGNNADAVISSQPTDQIGTPPLQSIHFSGL